MRLLRIRRLVFSFLFMAAVIFTTGAQAGTPNDALVMAWNLDAISTFDPAQIGELVTDEIIRNICEPLLNNDEQDESKIAPGVAESWEVSKDNKVITLHLRQDGVHPSGNPVTAEDAVWSIKRVLQLEFGASTLLKNYGFNKGNMDDAFKVVDEHTMQVKLQEPYPPNLIMLDILTSRMATVLDKKTLLANEVNNDLGHQYAVTHTACYGPYSLSKWNAGEVVVLEQNKNHWQGMPAMKRIIAVHVSEPSAQRLQLEKGDIDVARDLTPEDITVLQKNPDIKIINTRMHQITYLALSNANPIFKNDKVRLALKYLWDYEGLSHTVIQNIGIPRASVVPLGAFGALDKEQGLPFKLDIEKARSLLKEAGYADGFETSLLIGTLPEMPALAQHFQENASKVGIKVKIEQMANAELFSKFRSRKFESLLIEWRVGVPHAHGILSTHAFNPDNRDEAKLTQMPAWRGSWYRPEFNKMVEEAAFESNPEKQMALYHKIQLRHMQEGPYVYLFQKVANLSVRREVTSFPAHAFRIYYNKITK